MKCLTCGSLCNRVLRTTAADQDIRRLRQCDECGKRWVTIESPREVHDSAAEIRQLFAAMMKAAGPLEG